MFLWEGHQVEIDTQWEVVGTNQKCELKSTFRKHRFGRWSLICSGLEQKVRPRLSVLGGDSPKCLSQGLWLPPSFPDTVLCIEQARSKYLCLLLVRKEMKEARDYGQKLDSLGISLHNKAWGVMDDK